MNSVPPTTIEEYQALLLAMQDVLGVVLTEEKRDVISERLIRVMQHYGIDSMTELAKRIRTTPDDGLNSLVLEVLSEHDSSWANHADLPRMLSDYVLPAVAAAKPKKFRIWVTGCGRGDLAYLTAMVITEFQASQSVNTRFEIFASDISKADIELAKQGQYDADAIDGLSIPYQKKYLESEHNSWTVKSPIKQMVRFATYDLLVPFDKLGHFDLIICTDVLIYFSAAVRTQILEEFAQLLDPSGILFVGNSEAVMPFTQAYARVAHEAGVFYRQLPH